MKFICTDLEGVLVPEIWIEVAEATGIEELKLTTKDIADYDALMQKRIGAIRRHGITLEYIQSVIASMTPYEGAREFCDWARERCQLAIVSDTFTQFAGPLMRQLGWPTLFCNTLQVQEGQIIGYHMRQPDGKRKVVEALQSLNYEVAAMGDSYNDIGMLKQAETGVFFAAADGLKGEYPALASAETYDELKSHLESFMQ